jgi:hypothetical protein
MGLDVIQQSLSGTTMTICFGVLQRLDYGSAECQALVLVPTRDIAQETEKVIQSLGQYLGVKTHVCTGGYSAHTEQRILSSRVQVLIGTPGRVLDVLQRRALCPDHIAMFVLDEANELLKGRSKGQVSFLPAYLLIVVITVNDYVLIEVENDPQSIDSVHITYIYSRNTHKAQGQWLIEPYTQGNREIRSLTH